MEQNLEGTQGTRVYATMFFKYKNCEHRVMNVCKLKEYCSYEPLLRKRVDDNWKLLGEKYKLWALTESILSNIFLKIKVRIKLRE